MRHPPRRALAALLMLGLVSCNAPPKTPKRDGNTVRYRLLLRENPLSPRDASHCYAQCQSVSTPQRYVECLSECPGFEMTPGEYCSKSEVPPVAACLTVRRIPATKEPPPGLVILAVVGAWALAITAVSLCNSSSSQCGMPLPPPQ
ncbi:MAG TPA: hypothetical protein VJN18_10205 [Polyangiaceae bacterium]|nr:hypothetical protein [Polyangiaceae bacterium]